MVVGVDVGDHVVVAALHVGNAGRGRVAGRIAVHVGKRGGRARAGVRVVVVHGAARGEDDHVHIGAVVGEGRLVPVAVVTIAVIVAPVLGGRQVEVVGADAVHHLAEVARGAGADRERGERGRYLGVGAADGRHLVEVAVARRVGRGHHAVLHLAVVPRDLLHDVDGILETARGAAREARTAHAAVAVDHEDDRRRHRLLGGEGLRNRAGPHGVRRCREREQDCRERQILQFHGITFPCRCRA